MHKSSKVLAILLGLSLLLFSGCDIPYVTKAQVKKYVGTVEPKYNAAKAKAEEADKVFNENKDAADFSKVKDQMNSVKSVFSDALNTTKAQNPPQQANKLHQDLLNYYQEAIESIDKINTFVDFLVISGDTFKNMEEVTKKLNNVSSDNLNQLAADLKIIKADIEKIITDLESKSVDQSMKDAKEALINMNEAFAEVLGKIIIAAETNNVTALLTATAGFETEINQALESFTKEMDALTKALDLDNASDELNKLESDIDKDFSDLKSKYKF